MARGGWSGRLILSPSTVLAALFHRRDKPHPQAERKTELETDSLLDDFRREPIAAINGFRCRHPRAQIADVRRHFVNLTVPGEVRLDEGQFGNFPAHQP